VGGMEGLAKWIDLKSRLIKEVNKCKSDLTLSCNSFGRDLKSRPFFVFDFYTIIWLKA